MKDGTVLLWKYEKGKKWYLDLVGRAIVFFTGKPYTHAALWCDEGWQSDEKGVHSGPLEGYTEVWEPVRDLTPAEKHKMLAYLFGAVYEKRGYNFLKLVVLAIVYPTRHFWRAIGWVPFQSDFFGEVCSEFVDEAYAYAGIDLIPNENAEYTCPGDLAESKFLQRRA